MNKNDVWLIQLDSPYDTCDVELDDEVVRINAGPGTAQVSIVLTIDEAEQVGRAILEAVRKYREP
jgi:hypothetical protein